MLAANLVFALHVVILLAALLVPFVGSTPMLKGYSLAVPFVMIHWAINDDTCALTILEQVLRGERDRSKTFMGKLMGGVYNLSNASWDLLLKIVVFMLWLLVQFKLDRVL